MKTGYMPMFNIYENHYKSCKVSLEELNKLCKDGRCPYFYIEVSKNKFYENNDKPEFVFYLSIPLNRKNEKTN